ncbi:MAG: PHP domain-containing protein, partial [Anaerolineae bacterium]|nr:PHP domain-containing protein [Phycisphaerae bacterium]
MVSQSVDLHCHSTASDGTLVPRDVVRLAKDSGLSALALTDHDTVAGLREAAVHAADLGLDFLTGIEISCEFPRPGTMHMLGYGIDPDSATLRVLTTALLSARGDRNPQIVEKLNELGVNVTMDEWREEAKGGVLGRPHLAAILLRKGVVKSRQEAFDRYIGEGGVAYFDKERITSRRAITMIREAGGVAVLAHPTQLRRENFPQVETILKNLVDEGLAGVEVIHSDHDETWTRELERMADRFKILKTGGSDFHGSNKPDIQLGVARGR